MLSDTESQASLLLLIHKGTSYRCTEATVGSLQRLAPTYIIHSPTTDLQSALTAAAFTLADCCNAANESMTS